MGLVTGIRGISEATAPRKVGVRWLKLDDGQAVKLRFVNELDMDSPSYDSTRGLAAIAREHQNPVDFKRTALCSLEDEGKCWACEQAEIDKKWRYKEKFYINVLVDDGANDPYVAVWRMGTYRSTTFEMIKDYFMDNNAVSNLQWKLKRSGTKTDTTYTFMPTGEDRKPFDWTGVEPIDLNLAVNSVPYAQQAAFYGGGAVTVSQASDTSEPSGNDDNGIQW